jgi:hypothetical protein
MPTGLTTAWGYPIGAVGGQFNTMLLNNHPLTYEESLTSFPPTFVNGNLQTPLLMVPRPNSFGKRKINLTLKKLKSDLRMLTGKKKKL